MAGALVMAVAAPPATAGVSPSVLLLSSESSLQPVIDQILAAEQAAVAAASAQSFATPDSNVFLPEGIQNTVYELLLTAALTQDGTGNPSLFTYPEMVMSDAANDRILFGFFNASTQYYTTTGLDPDASYALTGTVGAGTGNLSLQPLATAGGTSSAGAALGLGDNLVVKPDGSFTVDIAPTKPSDAVNYLDNAGGILIRDSLSQWAKGPGSIHIECVSDCPATNPGITPTGLSDEEISKALQLLAVATPAFTKEMSIDVPRGSGILEPANTMSEIAGQKGQIEAGLNTQMTSIGHFDLQPGQALIVKVPDVQSDWGDMQLETAFGQTLPTVLSQTDLNNTQAFHDPDGYTYYVVSATNPGVANWLDSSAVTSGAMIARFSNIAPGQDVEGLPVTTQLVPVADVSKYLPDDTPTVSPEQFAADMNERVLTHDYALDTLRQNIQTSWVTQQLWNHDLQAAMGADNFDKVFGAEPFTPMWLRLTPALAPDWNTVAKDLLTDPSASFAAIRDNLALAQSDIAEPVKLAETLLQEDFTQTVQAVQGDLSSGDLSQALQDLAAGGKELASILNEALFDPNTSITAGFLNARDVLATAVMTANGGFPSQLGPLATWEWQHMSELTQLTPGSALTDLGSLLSPGDLLGG